jgi:hypothetical protein
MNFMQSFPKIEEKGTFPSSLYVAIFTSRAKVDEAWKERKLH